MMPNAIEQLLFTDVPLAAVALAVAIVGILAIKTPWVRRALEATLVVAVVVVGMLLVVRAAEGDLDVLWERLGALPSAPRRW